MPATPVSMSELRALIEQHTDNLIAPFIERSLTIQISPALIVSARCCNPLLLLN